MQLPKRQILSFSFFFFTTFLFCQSQSVKNFTISDGLSGNAINCIFKDSKGLLWIGTETGLSTYDGTNFNIIGEKEGLKYNFIWKIIEDEDKNIWISLYGNGVAKYDGKKFTYYSKKNGLINNSVRSLYYSKKHKCMVFGTEDGLSIFDGKKFKNFDIKVNNPTKKFQVNFIIEYKEKILFGVNHDRIYELKIDSKIIQKSSVSNNLFHENKNYSGFIQGDNFYNNSYSNEFVIYNLKTNKETNLGQCPVIWDYSIDNENSIYASCWDVNSSRGALLCFKNNKLINISESLKLPTTMFWCLYFDKVTNQLWVGSNNYGVFVLDLNKNISYISKDFLGESHGEINNFCFDNKGNYWIAGNNFIAKRKNNKTIFLTNEKLKKQLLTLLKNKTDSRNLKLFIKNAKEFICQSIKKDDFGTIWAFTNYGIFAIDDNLKILKYQHFSNTGGVFDFIDKDQILISQNYYFGYILNRNNTEKYKTILHGGTPVKIDAKKTFRDKNKIWIASYRKGLLLFENGGLKSMNDLGFINDKNISDVFIDSYQNVIIGTVSGKVYFSKWENNQLVHKKILNPDNDIIGNTIYFIQQYRNLYLIGTNKGLNIIKNFKLFKFLDKSENLKLSSYNNAKIDYLNDKLLISSNHDIISINLKSLTERNNVNSPIQITKIKINDKSIDSFKNLQLDYNENNIEIHFKSNNLYNASKNLFQYRIIGLNDKWSEYTSENSIKLMGLNSGKYHVLIKGKNLGTSEEIAPIKFNIYIKPPFWKTSWFIIASIIIVLGLIVLYIKRKIKKIKEKSDLEKRIAETKLQALQSQMNPHFVFNAMNSIQNFVIDNNTDDALWYIGEFSKLIRQTLDFSSKSTVRLEEEIDYLKRYIELENFRRKKKVIWVIDIDDSIDVHDIEIPPMLIQPIVENVFVHAFDSTILSPKLKIEFSKFENNIICIVTDNGIGIVNSNKFSKGLKLVEERVQLSDYDKNKRISFIKVLNGTSVKVEISIR